MRVRSVVSGQRKLHRSAALATLIAAWMPFSVPAQDGAAWQHEIVLADRHARAARTSAGFTLRDGAGRTHTLTAGRMRSDTASAMFDGLFALAQDEMDKAKVESITDNAFRNGQPIACPCFETGEKWRYVWTRDLSFAADLALARTATLSESLSLGPVVTGVVTRRGFVSRRKVRTYNDEAVRALRIRPPNLKLGIRWFSGGNQQKALLARSFASDFGVHVFDEPTVGIDVGAKVDVYEHMKRLAEAGKAVLVISSDTEELLGIAQRIYVVREGRVVADLRGEDRTETNVVNAFFGTNRPQVAVGGGTK